MKTTIYYFSGTGNSLVVARDLSRELGNAELISVPEAMKRMPEGTSDAVGIVFPVYIWGLPLIVRRFIERFPVQPSVYYFAVATYGGFGAGTLLQAEELLKQRGVTLAAGWGVKMPGNYTPMYGAISGNKQEKIFREEQRRIPEIASAVRGRVRGRIESNFFIVNGLFSGLIYGLSSPRIPAMDRDFRTDSRCNSCGICAKVCPVGNIALENAKPVWQHRCEQCLACLQWCPREAIQYGKVTAGRKRYHHPAVAMRDLMHG